MQHQCSHVLLNLEVPFLNDATTKVFLSLVVVLLVLSLIIVLVVVAPRR